MCTLQTYNRYSLLEITAYRLNGSGRCGIAAARSVLATQFGIYMGDTTIIELLKEKYTTPKETVRKNGMSPSDIAYCLRKAVHKPLKIFCSKRGNIRNLDYLLNKVDVLPIIHLRISYPEAEQVNPEGHYMLYGGSFKEFGTRRVRIFDTSRGEGFKYYNAENFLQQWFNKDERWYMIIAPESADLKGIKGKYL